MNALCVCVCVCVFHCVDDKQDGVHARSLSGTHFVMLYKFLAAGTGPIRMVSHMIVFQLQRELMSPPPCCCLVESIGQKINGCISLQHPIKATSCFSKTCCVSEQQEKKNCQRSPFRQSCMSSMHHQQPFHCCLKPV